MNVFVVLISQSLLSFELWTTLVLHQLIITLGDPPLIIMCGRVDYGQAGHFAQESYYWFHMEEIKIVVVYVSFWEN
jgi:hypothetical protein